jgi:hypothetical protein
LLRKSILDGGQQASPGAGWRKIFKLCASAAILQRHVYFQCVMVSCDAPNIVGSIDPVAPSGGIKHKKGASNRIAPFLI